MKMETDRTKLTGSNRTLITKMGQWEMALRMYHCDIVLIYYKGCELPTGYTVAWD